MAENHTVQQNRYLQDDENATVRINSAELGELRAGVVPPADPSETVQLGSKRLQVIRSKLGLGHQDTTRPMEMPVPGANGQQPPHPATGHHQPSPGYANHEPSRPAFDAGDTSTLRLGAEALRAIRDSVLDSGPATIQLSTTLGRARAYPGLSPVWSPPDGNPNQLWNRPPDPPAAYYRNGYAPGTSAPPVLPTPRPAPTFEFDLEARQERTVPPVPPTPPEAPTPEAEDDQPARRSRLVRGGMMMTVVSIANRLSSFAAQYFLGRLLFPDEFGLFAAALGLTSVGAAVRSALQPVLISSLEEGGDAVDRIYRTTLSGLWAFSLAGVALSGVIEGWLDAPGLQPLLIILLLLMPFQVQAGLGMARLSHSMQFGSVGKTLMVVPVVRHLTTVILAFLGLGPVSLVMGAAVSTFAELGALAKYTKLTIKPGVVSRQTLREIRTSLARFRNAANRRWIWVSALALTAASNGDFTVAKIWITETTLGFYYFAETLTSAFWLPLTLAVNTVLVPAFVSLKSVEDRRDRMVETVGTFAVLGVLMFNALTVVIVPITYFVWGSKWETAIPVILGLAIFAPLQFIHPVLQAIQRGTGAWGLYLADILMYAAGTVVAAGLGARFGGLMAIALAVVWAEILVTFITLIRLSSRFGVKVFSMLRVVLVPWFLGLVGIGAAHLIHPLHDPEIIPSVIRLGGFSIVTLALVVIPYRKTLLGLVSNMVSR